MVYRCQSTVSMDLNQSENRSRSNINSNIESFSRGLDEILIANQMLFKAMYLIISIFIQPEYHLVLKQENIQLSPLLFSLEAWQQQRLLCRKTVVDLLLVSLWGNLKDGLRSSG